MPLYQITDQAFQAIPESSFADMLSRNGQVRCYTIAIQHLLKKA
jgi:hypothetical protein